MRLRTAERRTVRLRSSSSIDGSIDVMTTCPSHGLTCAGASWRCVECWSLEKTLWDTRARAAPRTAEV